MLHPVDKGGKIRTYHMLKELRRHHHITYLTLDDGSAGEDACRRATEYCHELVTVPHSAHAKFTPRFYADLAVNLLSPLPYFLRKYRSAEMRREIAARVSGDRFDVLVCDFLVPSVNIPHPLGCATVLFQHNVEAMIWKRHFEVQRNPLKRLYLYEQWRKARRFERAACAMFDYVVAVSREDREIMQTEYGTEHVTDVPTGVDTEFFTPRGTGQGAPGSLVFTGSMDWLPNEDAIRYFIDRIMPLVRERVPDVRLTVVGRSPYPGLVELGRRDPSVVVTGRVDDVRPFIEDARVYIVPIRIGGGTRLKIFEAMAMEKPIISTTVGAEGLPVTDGEELLLADTPEAFAAGLVRLLEDSDFASALGKRAARAVRERFGWEQVATSFAAACELAVAASARRRRGRAQAVANLGTAA